MPENTTSEDAKPVVLMLGRLPRHRLADALPEIVARQKQDPKPWYKANRIDPPAFAAGK